MLRTFEYDDYPLSGRRFIREMDALKKRFPKFKCSCFAIPGGMTDKHWAPLLERQEWIETCPHGLVHQKRECREPEVYMLRIHWLDKIAEESRYTQLFKAPWHGIDYRFVKLLRQRNMDFCFGYMNFRFPFPTPDLKCWSLKDARTLDGSFGKHVEAHAIIPFRHKWHNKRFQQIDRYNIRTFTRAWSEDDEWEFVSKLQHPLCKKVYLGCGPHVFDGYDCFDPDTSADPRIHKWEAPDPIPIMPNRADVVLTAHMFNYLDAEWYQGVCDEIFRVLRPGGIARLQEDATDSGYVWRKPGQSSRGTGVIRSLPTKQRILKALRRAGFSVRLARPGTTQSPHKDILQADNRFKRWQRGHKFILEATKPASLEVFPPPEKKPRYRGIRP